jgi:hypothetical protein
MYRIYAKVTGETRRKGRKEGYREWLLFPERSDTQGIAVKGERNTLRPNGSFLKYKEW